MYPPGRPRTRRTSAVPPPMGPSPNLRFWLSDLPTDTSLATLVHTLKRLCDPLATGPVPRRHGVDGRPLKLRGSSGRGAAAALG